jgi:hypothetical protein
MAVGVMLPEPQNGELLIVPQRSHSNPDAWSRRTESFVERWVEIWKQGQRRGAAG